MSHNAVKDQQILTKVVVGFSNGNASIQDITEKLEVANLVDTSQKGKGKERKEAGNGKCRLNGIGRFNFRSSEGSDQLFLNLRNERPNARLL
jgi:hypothetical protein